MCIVSRSQGITQEQTLQTKHPGVVSVVGDVRLHAPVLTVRPVQAPANACIREQFVQVLHILRLQVVAVSHHLHLEQAQPFSQAQAQLRQLEQGLQGLHGGF